MYERKLFPRSIRVKLQNYGNEMIKILRDKKVTFKGVGLTANFSAVTVYLAKNTLIGCNGIKAFFRQTLRESMPRRLQGNSKENYSGRRKIWPH